MACLLPARRAARLDPLPRVAAGVTRTECRIFTKREVGM